MRKLFCIVCGARLKWSYEFCSDDCACLYVAAQDLVNAIQEEEDY